MIFNHLVFEQAHHSILESRVQRRRYLRSAVVVIDYSRFSQVSWGFLQVKTVIKK